MAITSRFSSGQRQFAGGSCLRQTAELTPVRPGLQSAPKQYRGILDSFAEGEGSECLEAMEPTREILADHHTARGQSISTISIVNRLGDRLVAASP